MTALPPWAAHGILSVVCAASVTLGCRPTPSRQASLPPQHKDQPASAFTGQRWLGQDSQRASQAGAGNSEVIALQAATVGDHVSGVISVPKGECILLLARASNGVDDLDLFAFGDDGEVLGVDDSLDQSPRLMVCPAQATRVFASARVASGMGLVALGAQHVARADAERVGKAMRARGGPGASRKTSDAWPNLDGKLEEHRAHLDGSWRVIRKAVLPVEARIPTHVSAEIEENTCIDLLSYPSKDVGQLDVSIADDQGRILGQAAAAGRDRTSLICSQTASTITVELQAQVGSGEAALVLSRSSQASLAGRSTGVLWVEATPTLDLKDLQTRRTTQLTQAGYAQPLRTTQGTIELRKRQSTQLTLPAGCARIDVLLGKPALGLEAWLWTDSGDLLAHSQSAPSSALFNCGPHRQVRLDLQALTHSGPYSVEARSEPGAPPLLQQEPLAAGRLLKRLSDLGLIALLRNGAAPQLVGLDAAHLERKPWSLAPGTCATAALALGPGTQGAEIRVLSRATGEELGLVHGSFATSIQRCAIDPKDPQDLDLELRVSTGRGPGLLTTVSQAATP